MISYLTLLCKGGKWQLGIQNDRCLKSFKQHTPNQYNEGFDIQYTIYSLSLDIKQKQYFLKAEDSRIVRQFYERTCSVMLPLRLYYLSFLLWKKKNGFNQNSTTKVKIRTLFYFIFRWSVLVFIGQFSLYYLKVLFNFYHLLAKILSMYVFDLFSFYTSWKSIC